MSKTTVIILSVMMTIAQTAFSQTFSSSSTLDTGLPISFPPPDNHRCKQHGSAPWRDSLRRSASAVRLGTVPRLSKSAVRANGTEQ
jgi:hypothetical protein